MTPALLGKKIGMTRVYDPKGAIVPVTVVQCTPNTVTQVKAADGKDGYNALQIGFGDVKAKSIVAEVALIAPMLDRLVAQGVNTVDENYDPTGAADVTSAEHRSETNKHRFRISLPFKSN